ncbi:MAG: Thiosulfate sulfurtransferase, rhodanese [Gemmatimonadetes bacterium]|nr:Thiosulfate sulfurtransferase, rhodanese [Gemmatimonadota bacterium]
MNVARKDAVDLAGTGWLEEHLGAPWLRVVDVRGEMRPSDKSEPRLRVARRSLGRAAASFLLGHVPGSTSLDVARRLYNDDGSVVTAPELAIAMSELGIGNEHSVVLVDDAQPEAALAAVWALQRYGHSAVQILAGGFPRWRAEGRPISFEITRPSFASFTARVTR